MSLDDKITIIVLCCIALGIVVGVLYAAVKMLNFIFKILRRMRKGVVNALRGKSYIKACDSILFYVCLLASIVVGTFTVVHSGGSYVFYITYLYLCLVFYLNCSYKENHNLLRDLRVHIFTFWGILAFFKVASLIMSKYNYQLAIHYDILPMFVVNIAAYLLNALIFDWSIILKKRRSKLDEENKRLALENDDMKKIKEMIASIPTKIAALDSFSDELYAKIQKLKNIAANAIENAYGDYSNGNNSIEYYHDLKDKYSFKIDTLLSAQCDKIIKKVSENITQKQETIKKNCSDIHKYKTLSQKLQEEYDRELKIEKMKKISGQLSEEISTSEDDFTTSINNKYLIQKTIDDFEQLNHEMEQRRNLEVEYGQIEI